MKLNEESKRKRKRTISKGAENTEVTLANSKTPTNDKPHSTTSGGELTTSVGTPVGKESEEVRKLRLAQQKLRQEEWQRKRQQKEEKHLESETDQDFLTTDEWNAVSDLVSEGKFTCV